MTEQETKLKGTDSRRDDEPKEQLTDEQRAEIVRRGQQQMAELMKGDKLNF